MDTADRDCRLYSVDGILQTGNGCRSEIFFLCSNADRTADKELSSSYSATIRGRQDIDIIRRCRERLRNSVWPKDRKYAGDNCFSLSTRFLTELRSKPPPPMWKRHALPRWVPPNWPTRATKNCMRRKSFQNLARKLPENSPSHRQSWSQAEAQEISARNNSLIPKWKVPVTEL